MFDSCLFWKIKFSHWWYKIKLMNDGHIKDDSFSWHIFYQRGTVW